VNNRLRLKEVAAVELAETHKQRLKAREDQIGIINAENIKNEAWALKTEWETWCKTKRLSLNRKTRVIIEGDIQFTDVETEMAVEIIRLSDSKNETLFSNFIWKARPNLEYQGYPTDPLPDSKTKEIIAIHDFIQKKLPLKVCVRYGPHNLANVSDLVSAQRRVLCSTQVSMVPTPPGPRLHP
jgi:hypothetical protein